MLLAASMTAGCGTPSLRQARREFYSGQIPVAEKTLSGKDVGEKNRVLFLMERGTVRQALADYENSAKDFIQAAGLIEEGLGYSISQGTASMVVNDNVQDFLGEPYERSCLYAMTALSHLALGRWDDAAVGARRIVWSHSPEIRKEYPDIAFCRYLAGTAFELIDDPSNAALQYRLASELVEKIRIDETGRLSLGPGIHRANATVSAKVRDPSLPRELICFFLSGRTTPGGTAVAGSRRIRHSPYANIYAGKRWLGRTYVLTDTRDLAAKTYRLTAARKAVKSTTRIIMKEVAADAAGAATDSEAIGELIRLILYLMEQPDIRRWETLPGRLHVARVPCPADLTSYQVKWLGETHEVTQPIVRRGNVFVSVCRILPKGMKGHRHKAAQEGAEKH